MNKYPIFYIINGQFYENSDSNSQKLKKVTLIFENDNPKRLRGNALKKFSEIRDNFLVRNNAAAPTYHVVNSIGKLTCVDAIENVPFFTKQNKLNLALTLSYGIKGDSRNYNLIDSDKYPYNKNLYPISAIGDSLHQVEDSLKVNLILEKQFYETFNEELPQVDNIKDFIDIDFLKDYIISNCMGNTSKELQKLNMLKKVLKNEVFEIFSTSQFYSFNILENSIEIEARTFLELYSQSCNQKLAKQISIYQKELENITHFYKVLHGSEVDFMLSDTRYVHRNLRKQILKPFFTQAQICIYEEMKKLNSEITKESSESMKSLIEKYL